MSLSQSTSASACKPRAFRGFCPDRCRRRLKCLLVALSKTYGFDFALPASFVGDFDLPTIKRFCSNPCDGSFKDWSACISRLSANDRLSVTHSIFLFRKTLPSPSLDLLEYTRRMSKESDNPDPDFLSFLGDEIDKMFFPGWDRGYTSTSLNVSPPVTSCFESNREKYGARGMTSAGSWLSHSDYVERVLDRESSSYFTRPFCKIAEVDTGGKKRIISVPTVDMNLLRPLHYTMYDFLTRQGWCLRGDATARRFSDFTRVPGEVFVSGDYSSATDNLNSHIQRFVLDRVLSRCTSVPYRIRVYAQQSLNMLVKKSMLGASRDFVQGRGQMMGNLVSFPLLCLVNYLSFRYLVPRKGVPVRVNGDDIVFRCTKEEQARWFDGIGRCGLVLNREKTLVDPSRFSLNSAIFAARKSRVWGLSFVRSSALWCRDEEVGLYGLRGRWGALAPCLVGARRRVIREVFLRENWRWIMESRRSLRSMGIVCDASLLASSGLYDRERFYLSSVVEFPLTTPGDAALEVFLEGWRRVKIPRSTKESRSLCRQRAGELNHALWGEGAVSRIEDLTSEEVPARFSPPVYTPWRSRKCARLLGVSLTSARLYLSRGVERGDQGLRVRRTLPELGFRRPDLLAGMVDSWDRVPDVAEPLAPPRYWTQPVKFVAERGE